MLCQTGRSKRHPHQEAQDISKTFFPRYCESECSLPSRSGRVKSGASSERKRFPISSGASLNDQRACCLSCTEASPSCRAKAERLNKPGRTKLDSRSGEIGTQRSPRHAPCGLSSHPVAQVKSAFEIQRFSPSILAL